MLGRYRIVVQGMILTYVHVLCGSLGTFPYRFQSNFTPAQVNALAHPRRKVNGVLRTFLPLVP